MTEFFLTLEDIEECTETFEQATARLLSCEERLAKEHGLTGDNIREQLLQLETTGVLDDGDIGTDWRFAYDTYLYWIELNPDK